MDRATMAVFTGNANPQLAQEIARHLMVPLGRASVSRFSDSECTVELLENVRGRDVFIVQPTCSPANDHLMELLVMVDACRRASAARITAVIPYFGYARQDRRPRAMRVPITAKLCANMIASARALAKRLDDADLAIIDKRRPRANESEVMNIIGEVKGKTCVLIDDLVDTAGTLCHAAKALKEAGGKRVLAYITHAV